MAKVSKIDILIIACIYLMVVVLGFFGIQRSFNRILIAVILIRLIIGHSKSLLKNKFFLFGALIVVLLVISSLFLNGLHAMISVGWGNLLILLYSMIYALYFYALCKYNSLTIKTVYQKSAFIINATMIANVIAVIYQINHPGQLIAAISPNYDADVLQKMVTIGDTASGFFAFGSVHTLCIFSVFTIIYNLSFSEYLKRKWQKILIGIYIIFIAVINLGTSLLNDNKAFFILLPMALLIYFFMGLDLSKKSMTRVFTVIAILLITAMLMIVFNSSFLVSLTDTLVDMANFSRVALQTGAGNGSNERIAIPIYALKKSSTWIFGMGIGVADYYRSGFLGFNHFGQSDMGTFLVFFGVWISVLIFIYFLKIYERIIMPSNYKRSAFVSFLMILLFVLMMIFTQIITNYNNQITLLLLILALRMRYIAVQSGSQE